MKQLLWPWWPCLVVPILEIRSQDPLVFQSLTLGLVRFGESPVKLKYVDRTVGEVE